MTPFHMIYATWRYHLPHNLASCVFRSMFQNWRKTSIFRNCRTQFSKENQAL